MKKIFTFFAAAFLAIPMYINAQSGLMGFATHSDLGLNGTTGGGQGEVVRVTTREELAKYAAGTTPYVIIIENDIFGNGINDIKDELQVGSNKTIVGAGAGVSLDGICINLNGQQNVIIRNISISNGKPDGMAFRNTHHVWVDHCDLSKCDDGMLDFTIGSSYLTVSWSKFHDHDKALLLNSGTGHFEDRGKMRATYHHNSFINTVQRNPRVGYGLGHVFNCYYEKNNSYCIGFHTGAKMVAENCYFFNTREPFEQMYTDDPLSCFYGNATGSGNKFVATTGDKVGTGVGFDIKYYYDYAFAMHTADETNALKSKMGMQEGIEHDIIPFPGNGAIDVKPGTELMVGALDNNCTYAYTIGTSTDNLTTYDDNFVLAPATTYYWQAQVTTADSTYTSGVFRFTTASEKTSLPTPENGNLKAWLREPVAEFAPCEPTKLRWHTTFNAQYYKVYLSEDEIIDENDYVGETDIAEFAPTERLKFGQHYYWRVDAVTTDNATITGDVWNFASEVAHADIGRTELENMVLNGYAYKNNPTGYFTASNNMITMGEAGPGSLSAMWKGESDIYNITTTYFDESDGQGWWGLYINEDLQDEWTTTDNNEKLVARTTKNVTIHTGDEIRLDFYTHNKEQARADCIDIALASESAITEVAIDSHVLDMHSTELRVYSIVGQYLGNTLQGLEKGVYIVNGQKVVIR